MSQHGGSADEAALGAPAAGGDVVSRLLAVLPVKAAVVRRAAFARLLGQRPASAFELAADTGLSVADVEDELAELARTGTATVGAAGDVVAVGGLSIVSAAHQLHLDGTAFWTWCAFDAIGIPAALGADAIIGTRCEHCRSQLELVLTRGQPPAESAVVGWLPGAPCTNVQADFCPAANLFCGPDHLAAWRRQAGDPPGATATLPELAELGRRVWAEMTPEATRRRSTMEAPDEP